MSLKRCPICELNYIQEDEKYCNICRRNIRSGMRHQEEQSLCAECGEPLSREQQELCTYCLNELRRREKLEKLMEKPALIELDVEQLDEMDVDMSDEIQGDELNDIGDEFEDEDAAEEDDDIDEP